MQEADRRFVEPLDIVEHQSHWPSAIRHPIEQTRHGLLHSKKGKGGGYLLGRKPTDITVGQIIRVLEGPLALTPCVSQTAYRRCEECIDEKTCAVRLAMKEVRDSTAQILDNTTLAGLNAQVPGPRRKRRG